MRTKKLLVSVLLCSALVSCSVSTCFAERILTITETQLTQLGSNNKQSMIYNEKLLKESSVLKEQVKTLQQQLIESKSSLAAAQQSLKIMKESTEKLERRTRANKIGAGAIITNHGTAPAIAYKTKDLELFILYSNEVKGGGAMLWF